MKCPIFKNHEFYNKRLTNQKKQYHPTFQPPHLRDLPPNQDKENGENDGHLPGFPKPQPLYLEDHPKWLGSSPILVTPGHFCWGEPLHNGEPYLGDLNCG